MYLLVKLKPGVTDLLGLKEALCMEVERYADIERVDVVEESPEQIRLGGAGWKK